MRIIGNIQESIRNGIKVAWSNPKYLLKVAFITIILPDQIVRPTFFQHIYELLAVELEIIVRSFHGAVNNVNEYFQSYA